MAQVHALTFYAHSTHLASNSFVGYNIKDTLIMLNVVPLSLRMVMGVVFFKVSVVSKTSTN